MSYLGQTIPVPPPLPTIQTPEQFAWIKQQEQLKRPWETQTYTVLTQDEIRNLPSQSVVENGWPWWYYVGIALGVAGVAAVGVIGYRVFRRSG
ncbi:MAG: hypothetical protein Q8O94_02735 [bacterium]|nr:hypothetical protein [bacterium]